MSTAAQLHAAIAAIAPIESVSIGRKNDKATWRIQWVGTPTVGQLAQAQAAITAFDVASAEAKDVAADALAATDAKMARIAEEIYDALLAKNVLKANDFPADVAATISVRKTERAKL